MQGINVSVFAYGNTGAGKTFTMLGNEKKQGIIPRTVRQLFTTFQNTSAALSEEKRASKYVLKISYFEIYNEKVYDLVKFTGQDLCIREDLQRQILIPGLSLIPVESFEEFQTLFTSATRNRTTAATRLNAASSRSHSVLTLLVECSQPNGSVVRSKMHLIDLAGSEDNRKTENSGIRLIESSAINKSLFVLGKVVDALNANDSRIPYRDSKLTRILQDSLGGKSQSLLIANLSPSDKFHLESFNTLNFASKSRQVCNNVVQQEALPHSQSQYITSYPTNKTISRLQNAESSLLLSPMIKKKKIINEQLINRCEQLERQLLLKEGKVPLNPDSPPHKKFSPNTKKTVKQLNAQMKEHENNFDYAKAIDCARTILQIAPHDEKMEKKLASLQRTHDSIVSQMIQTSRGQRNNLIEDSPCPLKIVPEKNTDSFVSLKNNENLENVFCTPLNQIIPSPTSLAAEHALSDSTESARKKKIAESELVHIFNTGNKGELMKIKGIGNKRAEQIAAYRLTRGMFHGIEDFLKIDGFTQKILDNILLLRIAETMLGDQ